MWGWSGGGSMSPVGPILDGLGGAMLLTGLVTGLLTLDADSRLSAMCDGTSCYPDAESILGERHTLAITTDVLLGVGIAAATTGLVLWLTGALDEEREVPIASLGCGAHACALTLTERF